MFPTSFYVEMAILNSIYYGLAEMAVGAVTGLVICLVFKLNKGGIFRDALIGGTGCVAGFFAVAIMPWPRNTIVYMIGQTTVTSTENSYQHPERVAFAAAVILPLLYELYRFVRSRSKMAGSRAALL